MLRVFVGRRMGFWLGFGLHLGSGGERGREGEREREGKRERGREGEREGERRLVRFLLLLFEITHIYIHRCHVTIVVLYLKKAKERFQIEYLCTIIKRR